MKAPALVTLTANLADFTHEVFRAARALEHFGFLLKFHRRCDVVAVEVVAEVRARFAAALATTQNPS